MPIRIYNSPVFSACYSPVDEVISTLSEAMKKTQAKLDAETDEAKKLMFTKTINRANVASENLSKMKNNPQDLSAEKIAVSSRYKQSTIVLFLFILIAIFFM